MITPQRIDEIGAIFSKWNEREQKNFCLFYALIKHGIGGNPLKATTQEKLKEMMQKMGVSLEEMQEIEHCFKHEFETINQRNETL